jgi:excisionase family DNA binding protein
MKSTGVRYLSTAEAARLLGVGPTSVKRWADLGLLRCVRTAGHHRRFLQDEVERFARSAHSGRIGAEPPRAPPPPPADERVHAWADRLLGAIGPYALQGALLAEREACGAWWRVADLLGGVLAELGRRWEAGQISVVEEHLCSEQLARGLARCSDGLPPADDDRVAMLATAECDEHTLGLSLAELVLREAGYRVAWVGRHTPASELALHLRHHPVALVGLSASTYVGDPDSLHAAAFPVALACQQIGARLVLGGGGAWPDDLPGAYRIHNFAGLRELLVPAA